MSSTDGAATRGQVAQAISNAVVRLLREYTGRGPTRAHTTINDNLVAVVLRDTLLKAERTLVEDGQGEAVIDIRRRFQHAMETALVQVVSDHTGREVEAFLSTNHVDPDIAVEIFILKSRDDHDRRPVAAADTGLPHVEPG